MEGSMTQMKEQEELFHQFESSDLELMSSILAQVKEHGLRNALNFVVKDMDSKAAKAQKIRERVQMQIASRRRRFIHIEEPGQHKAARKVKDYAEESRKFRKLRKSKKKKLQNFFANDNDDALVQLQKKLELTEKELAITKVELEVSEQDLANTKSELELSHQELAKTKDELELSEQKRAYTKNELEIAMQLHQEAQLIINKFETTISSKEIQDNINDIRELLQQTKKFDAIPKLEERITFLMDRRKSLESNRQERKNLSKEINALQRQLKKELRNRKCRKYVQEGRILNFREKCKFMMQFYESLTQVNLQYKLKDQDDDVDFQLFSDIDSSSSSDDESTDSDEDSGILKMFY